MPLPEKKTILFTLVYRGEEHPVRTYANEYYSLMSLVSVQLSIWGFGMCNGMGSCGTCLVTIYSGNQPSGRNVLACDVRINDDLANVRVLISETRY